MQTLEQTLGYVFQDVALLRVALTHPSFGQGEDNQRMEYLGDAVLQLCVSTRLYALFPKESEGQLSRRRAALVREETLALAARRLRLGEALRLGAGENGTGGREKPSVLSDAMEAVIAAVYLDGGMDAATALVDQVMEKYEPPAAQRDHKTLLQEYLQALGKPAPLYEMLEKSGPDHAPTFVCAAVLQSQTLARGSGKSKKHAEQQAAEIALIRLTQSEQKR